MMAQDPGISIHALLAESDKITDCHITTSNYFYPRSPCGERRNDTCGCQRYDCISIHALLAESDRGKFIKWKINHHFYPRSPCGERRYNIGLRGCCRRISIHALLAESDDMGLSIKPFPISFLSTLSLRRATQVFQRIAKPFRISIHALLAESDHQS